MKKTILITLLSVFNGALFSQVSPFNIHLETVEISNLGGIQSFAFGQAEGKWLIIGGRLDGLHRRQPFAAFDIAGHNNQLIVVDPNTQQKWSAPLNTLPTSIQEQLSATNMNFYQNADKLYFVGGYGFSGTASDHITYPYLTEIMVSDVINAVINNKSFTAFFRQISHPQFQVTGGRLKKIYNTYYLLGGQKFMGRYNPQGPNFGPGFTQEYTNAIRRFKLVDDGTNLVANFLPEIIDKDNLHRRDYNAEPQILPNGEEGICMFSGVFQETANIPFLNAVVIDSANYSVKNDFQQYYNHYHCAVLPLYSERQNEMHTVFFGGIAQYYESNGSLIQDNEVPFVKTIARVTRNTSGNMTEFKLPIEMPSFLGAGSEFIPNKQVPHYNNEVLKLDEFDADSTLVGYIFGGISSTAENIFFTNTGNESSASNQVFKVFVIKNQSLNVDFLNEQSISSLQMQIFPNPSNGNLSVKVILKNTSTVTIEVNSIDGKLIEKEDLGILSEGEHILYPKATRLLTKGIYIISIITSNNKISQQFVVN